MNVGSNIYHIKYAIIDAEEVTYNIEHKNMGVMWFSLMPHVQPQFVHILAFLKKNDMFMWVHYSQVTRS